jgi:CDP-glucose 4,6-dehydratase
MDRVLITGHTGFKGSWLALLLKELGHEISGISLDHIPGSLFETEDIHSLLAHDLKIDIRNREELFAAFEVIAPDTVYHFAAQPLVRESYREPELTYETNVTGTINVLDAISRTSSVRRLVVATTDKVYRNNTQSRVFVESDPLGGHDPYSSSKAMVDIYSQEWAKRHPQVLVAVVRAGNVIGGGDRSPERLVPDILNALSSGSELELRNPEASRPWQHVLDCVYGYHTLIESINQDRTGEPWNVGPDHSLRVSVDRLARDLISTFGRSGLARRVRNIDSMIETSILALDSSKIQKAVNWSPILNYEEMIRWTLAADTLTKSDSDFDARAQIREYIRKASSPRT